jgi:hypothetical protein
MRKQDNLLLNNTVLIPARTKNIHSLLGMKAYGPKEYISFKNKVDSKE